MNLNRIKVLILVLITFLLAGCKEYGERRIVKLITIDKENISLYYYDYSTEKPTYKKEEKENKGIEGTIVELLAEADYDLKLCRYAICDNETIQNQVNEVFNALTNTRFSPDISIMAGNTNDNPEKYISAENKGYPIYNFRRKGDKITGIIEHADTDEKNMIISSEYYTTLNNRQGIIFDVITDNLNSCDYVFADKNKTYSAKLENISVYFYTNGVNTNVDIYTNVKSYKGMPADDKYKDEFIKLLSYDIEKTAESLFSDKPIAEEFGLLWHKNLHGTNDMQINIKIK